jgi:hypothetical protein
MNERKDSLQRGKSRLGTSWNIDNQCGADGSRHGATHGSQGSFLQPLAAHVLAKAVENTVADAPSCLRRNVAWGDPSAPRGDYQWCPGRLFANFIHNALQVVRNHDVVRDHETGLLQAEGYGWARPIIPKPLKTRVADGDDDCLHSCDSTRKRPQLLESAGTE